jgi:hypothetical protein
MAGTGQTYTITGPNAGNTGTMSWTSFENISDTGNGTLRATNATWTLNGSNSGTVTNLSGSFSGMSNLQDSGTGTLREANAVWTITAANAGTVTNLSGGFSGMGSLYDMANTGTLQATGATWTLNGSNSGTVTNLSGTFSGMANLADASGGQFNLSLASNNVTGMISSAGAGPAACQMPNASSCASLNSNVDITSLNVSVPGMLILTGSANTWKLGGSPQPSGFGATNPNANVFFNGTCVGGPACGTVITITGSIGATLAQMATQALRDALDTDSVTKQIDYGFAGDVGTTPPMDHRIDETGISTPECFEESRDSQPCR